MTYAKVSTGGWIVFVFLMLSCFGIILAWIGLLMKENYKVCSQCGIKLGWLSSDMYQTDRFARSWLV